MTQTENEWWSNLEGEDIEINAYGIPPYDVEAVADFISHYCQIKDNEIVLDLGCGPGRLIERLAIKNPRTTFIGVDVSPTMVRLTTEKQLPNVVAFEVEDDLPWLRLDSVYSVTVLQHLPHEIVQSYFTDIYNNLNKQGKFIFTYAEGDDDHFLSHQMTKTQVAYLLVACGFSRIIHLITPPDHPTWSWVLAEK